MKTKHIIILLILILSATMVSGCTTPEQNNNTSIENTSEPIKEESKIDPTWVKIESDVFDRTPENTPLYEAGYYASIEMGEDTYYIPNDGGVYDRLINYFGTGGTDKPFYATIENRTVLYGDDSMVITDIFDMEGERIN